ncbi:hypothetical protein ACLOJK_027957 [Asimina triloba]
MKIPADAMYMYPQTVGRCDPLLLLRYPLLYVTTLVGRLVGLSQSPPFYHENVSLPAGARLPLALLFLALFSCSQAQGLLGSEDHELMAAAGAEPPLPKVLGILRVGMQREVQAVVEAEAVQEGMWDLLCEMQLRAARHVWQLRDVSMLRQNDYSRQ